MNKKVNILLVLLSVLLAGCSQAAESAQPYNQQLAEFLTQHATGYAGDNHYYHVVDDISSSEASNQYMQILTGEVLNTDIGRSGDDFHFTLTSTVTANQLLLTSEGDKLNESDYDRVVALQMPLVKEATWTFKANREPYRNLKVTAQITDVTDDQITVHYEDRTGYEEIRILTKARGTTDFYKYYQYQNARVVTGYHEDPTYETIDLVHTNDFDAIQSIVIDHKLHELIINYNMAWEQYVKNGDNDIFQYVIPDSPASEALNAMGHFGIEIDFIAFKPTEIDLDGENCQLTLTEAFFDQNGQMVLNEMMYEIHQLDGTWGIYDFERM